jgi:hypothetical protein
MRAIRGKKNKPEAHLIIRAEDTENFYQAIGHYFLFKKQNSLN